MRPLDSARDQCLLFWKFVLKFSGWGCCQKGQFVTPLLSCPVVCKIVLHSILKFSTTLLQVLLPFLDIRKWRYWIMNKRTDKQAPLFIKIYKSKGVNKNIRTKASSSPIISICPGVIFNLSVGFDIIRWQDDVPVFLIVSTLHDMHFLSWNFNLATESTYETNTMILSIAIQFVSPVGGRNVSGRNRSVAYD